MRNVDLNLSYRTLNGLRGFGLYLSMALKFNGGVVYTMQSSLGYSLSQERVLLVVGSKDIGRLASIVERERDIVERLK